MVWEGDKRSSSPKREEVKAPSYCGPRGERIIETPSKEDTEQTLSRWPKEGGSPCLT